MKFYLYTFQLKLKFHLIILKLTITNFPKILFPKHILKPFNFQFIFSSNHKFNFIVNLIN